MYKEKGLKVCKSYLVIAVVCVWTKEMGQRTGPDARFALCASLGDCQYYHSGSSCVINIVHLSTLLSNFYTTYLLA